MSIDLERMRSAGAGAAQPAPFDREAYARTLFGDADREAMAQRLLQAGDVLGRVVAEVEGLWRHDLAAVQAEEANCDRIVIDGPELIRSLSALAMRLDRAAAVKHSTGD